MKETFYFGAVLRIASCKLKNEICKVSKRRALCLKSPNRVSIKYIGDTEPRAVEFVSKLDFPWCFCSCDFVDRLLHAAKKNDPPNHTNQHETQRIDLFTQLAV
jgi:hypothetical protein